MTVTDKSVKMSQKLKRQNYPSIRLENEEIEKKGTKNQQN